jgi:alpha-D-ribose 1-methylphosphonate 5-phosphate C-P lyase
MPIASTLSPDRLMRGDDGDLYQLDGTNTDSVRGWLGGVVYRNVAASAAHSNTLTEALFDTQYSIPANTLKAGTVIKVRFQGIATATNATDTLTIKLYIGGLSGTAILTGTATDVANNDIFCGEATIVVRTVGASGTFVAYGSHSEVPAASGTATLVYEITASTTIDTTAAQVIGVGADWSVASASNSCRLDILVVEIN